jgi:hypothetical protein
LALRSSTSFADSTAAAAVLEELDARDARGAWRVVVVAPTVVPVTEDSRFFASATAPVAAGFGAARVVVAGADEVVVDDLEVVVVAGFGGAGADAVGGFLAAAVVAAVLLDFGLLGEGGAPLTAVEVRRDVAVALEAGVRFFSSSETEGRERCETAEAAVDGRFAAVVLAAAGLAVVGLLAVPAVLVRVAELVVELAADLVEVAPAAAGRRVAEVGAAAVLFAVGVPVTGFFAAAPFVAVGDAAAAGAGAGAGAGASVCWTTSKPSASDMMGNGGCRAGQCGRGERREAGSRAAAGLLSIKAAS